MRPNFLKPSIGNAIFALAGLLIALMAIVAAINSAMSQRVGNLIGSINQTYVPVYGMLARAHVRSLEQSLALRQASIDTLARGGADLDPFLDAEKTAGAAAEEELAGARAVVAAQARRAEGVEDRVLLGRLDAHIEEMLRGREAYARDRDELLSALRRSDPVAIQAALVRLDAARAVQNERLEQARRESLAFATKAVDETQESGRSVIRLTLLTLAFAVLLGLLMAYIVTRRLVGSMRRLVLATEQVEHGRYDGELAVTSDDEIGRLTRAFNLMLAELRLKEKIRETFGRYLDPKVVSGLLERPDLVGHAGERRVMTILFVDMRGFTRLSGEVTPTLLITILNRYLTVLTDEVRAFNGIVDKYTGDGVMAFWGPPFVDAGDQARLACEAAVAQLARFEAFRHELPDLMGVRHYAPNLGIRIGIATGEVIAGNVGSPVAMNYTVMGEAVNIASRLEGLNKIYGTGVLISDATARMAGPSVRTREIDTVRVQGHAGFLPVFEVLGPASTGQEEALSCYADALLRYRERDWAEAARGFEACLTLRPNDGPAALMLSRCTAFLAEPPPESWDGVFDVGAK
jgi:class 3 adenylate cyclase